MRRMHLVTIDRQPGSHAVLRGMTAAECADSLAARLDSTLSTRLSRILGLLSEEERECLITRTVVFLVARRGRTPALPFDE